PMAQFRPDQTPPSQPPKNPRQPASWLRLALLAGVGLYIVILLAQVFPRFGGPPRADISYSTLKTQIAAGNVSDLTLQGQDAQGDFKTPVAGTNGVTSTQFDTTVPADPGLTDPSLFTLADSHDVNLVVKADTTSGIGSLLFTLLPFVVLIALWVWFIRRSG